MVKVIFEALTGTVATFQGEKRASCNTVITDFSYLLNGRITILGENKSPKAFEELIGTFMRQIQDESS